MAFCFLVKNATDSGDEYLAHENRLIRKKGTRLIGRISTQLFAVVARMGAAVFLVSSFLNIGPTE